MKSGSTDEADTSPEDDEYIQAMAELKLECDKQRKKRSQVKIKDLMEKTFNGRRKWIVNDRPLVAEVLKAFPPLGESKDVSSNKLTCLGQ